MSEASEQERRSGIDRIKPSVRRLGAYHLAEAHVPVKLNQNESPYDLPEPLKRRVLEEVAARSWNRYPGFVPSALVGAIAERHGCDPEGVLTGNGSNELIQAVLAVTVTPGAAVVVPEPTFSLYALLTEVHEGRVVPVPLRGDLSYEAAKFAETTRREEAAVVVVCSPNNPTGSVVSREEVRRLHDGTDALIVVDHAYLEFGGEDAGELLDRCPRLVVLRTFSKAMGMAGLRAGYLLTSPELAREVAKAKLPYNLNIFTERAALAVLREPQALGEPMEALRAARDRIFRELEMLSGIHPYRSEANFVLFRVARDPVGHAELFRRLRDEHGVLIRDVSHYPMLDGCLRVSAGNGEETDAFLSATRTILEGS